MAMPHGPAHNPVARRQRWARRAVGVILVLLLLGAVSYSVSRAVTARAFIIPTNSMAPTLRSGDRVLVDGRPGRAPRRGEVWVFQAPPASGAGRATFAKRIVGLPGETIEARAGRLLIDGRPLDEPYLIQPFTYSAAPVRLGSGEYWALGDARDASKDSHAWGPLPADHLIGPIRSRVWPPNRLGAP